MKRLTFAALIAIACFACRARPKAPPAASHATAQALVDYLESQGRIRRDARSAIPLLLQNYLLARSPSACNLRVVENAPSRIRRDAVSTYIVDMRGAEALCRDAPDAASCGAIHGSCLAVETAIFCDETFDHTMMLLPAVAYTDLYLWVWSIEKDRVETPEERELRRLSPMGSIADLISIPPLLRTQSLAALIEHAHARAHNSSDTEQDKIVRDARYMSTCHGTPFAELPLLLGAYGPVIAHEYAHVEQFACPTGALPAPKAAATAIEKYRELSCSIARTDELAADLRSIELLDDVLLQMLFDIGRVEGVKIQRCNPDRITTSDELEHRIIQRLRGEYYSLFAIGLMTGGEYRAITRVAPTGTVSIVRSEPDLGDDLQHLGDYKASLLSYYQRMTYEREARATAGRQLLGHMTEPYRIALLLTSTSQVLIARTFPRRWQTGSPGFFATGYRMEGILRGHAEALHERDCRASRRKSVELAEQLVQRTFPSPPDS